MSRMDISADRVRRRRRRRARAAPGRAAAIALRPTPAARCSPSTARAFPSDTLSTHVNFPSAVAEIQRVGALDRGPRLRAAAVPRRAWSRRTALAACRSFAAVDGIDYGICVPRTAARQGAGRDGARGRRRGPRAHLAGRRALARRARLRRRDLGARRRVRQVDCKLRRRRRRATVDDRDAGRRGTARTAAHATAAAAAFWYMDDPQVGTEWRDRLIQLRAGPTHTLIFPCPDDRMLCLFMGPAEEIPQFRADPEGMWEAHAGARTRRCAERVARRDEPHQAALAPATTPRSSAAPAARAGRWPATPGTSRTRSSARASATRCASGGSSARRRAR